MNLILWACSAKIPGPKLLEPIPVGTDVYQKIQLHHLEQVMCDELVQLNLLVDIYNPGYRYTVASFACILALDTCTFPIHFQCFSCFIQNSGQQGD